MTYKLRTFVCITCGAITRRNRHPDDRRECRDCGIERAAQAAREMAAKSGPAWEAWRTSNADGARNAG